MYIGNRSVKKETRRCYVTNLYFTIW